MPDIFSLSVITFSSFRESETFVLMSISPSESVTSSLDLTQLLLRISGIEYLSSGFNFSMFLIKSLTSLLSSQGKLKLPFMIRL